METHMDRKTKCWVKFVCIVLIAGQRSTGVFPHILLMESKLSQ